jgi:preprotein translocase subunit SecF
MEFFKPGTRYDIMSKRRGIGMMSLVLVLASWALVGVRGLNFGIDFVGGTEILVKLTESTDLATLRGHVTATGLDAPEVVTYGVADEGRYFIRSRTQGLLTPEEREKVRASVVAKLGEPTLWDTSDETGEEVRVRFAEAKPEADLLAALKDAGFTEDVAVTKQAEGTNPVYILRLPSVRQRVEAGLRGAYGEKFASIDRVESVGSAVGKQLRNQGILAVLYALIGILLYLSFRFDLTYSPGAVAALVHDVSITIGIFSLTGMEFNLPIIAALLAIVGYSLNDTIVVYDRIREAREAGVAKELEETLNIAISDTLSRTVLTSVTTFLAVLSIFVFGGGIIQNFAFAMLIGVVVGTYSSIFIASPLVLVMDARRRSRLAVEGAGTPVTPGA